MVLLVQTFILDPLVYFLYITFKEEKEIYSVPLIETCVWGLVACGTDGTDEMGISAWV